MATERPIGEIVRLAAAGDDSAFTELYERTSNHAYYLALQLLKDDDAAQDILEETYIKALTNIGTLQDPSKFQGWLNSIVVNSSKDYLKKKKPVLFSQLASSDDSDDEQVDFADESEQFSPEATVDYNETKRLVKEMIDNLPEQQRIAIILHYMEDYSVKDIAQMMECSEGTVKSRLNYGRKQIEQDVLKLEKQGTKLYCAPLVPFLFWMFHTEVPAATISEAAAATLGAGVAAGSAVGATTATGSAVEASVSAGAAFDAEVATGSAVEAAVSTGSEIGATVAEGSTVGATVSAGTASSTVGATVTAEASAAGAAGAATAAGAGAAAGTAAGTAAAATGLSLAAKIGIVAAIVCIGGGAAIGVTAMSRNSAQNEAVVAEVENNDEGKEHGSLITELVEDLIEEEEPIPEITAEEMAALKRFYAAMQTEDYYTVANAFLEDFPTIYALERTYFPGQSIIFDGEALSRELEGYKLVVETSSTMRSDGNIRFGMDAYLGNFANAKPYGEVMTFTSTYPQKSGDVDSWYECRLMTLNYEEGEIFGQGELQYGFIADDVLTYETISRGRYSNADPVGEFEIRALQDFTLFPVNGFEVMEDGVRYERFDRPDYDVIFHVNAEEIVDYCKNKEGGRFGNDIRDFVTDDSGVFYADVLDIYEAIEINITWSGTSSYHKEGSENFLPDGRTIEEYVQSQNGQTNTPDSEVSSEVSAEVRAFEEAEAESPLTEQNSNLQEWEAILYTMDGVYQGNGIFVEQYCISSGEGEEAFLYDENGDPIYETDRPEWEDYARVRITGELINYGDIMVHDLTPVTVFDKSDPSAFVEVPYDSAQTQSTATQPETTAAVQTSGGKLAGARILLSATMSVGFDAIEDIQAQLKDMGA